MVDTNASDSIFVLDFQINATIVLMLEDIENVQKVRVEGPTEDIEITLNDGELIFSQANALANPYSVKNARKNFQIDTVHSIIEGFNSRVLTTKRSKPFNMNSFNALLKNRKYTGVYSYQDVVIPDGVPAIVPEDLFCRVQQLMEKNKRAPAHSKAKESEFLLTTKLFCGKCERMMVGESGKSHAGAMHYYYKCGNAKRKKGCDKKAVKKDWIERAVVRLTMERVLNEEKINRTLTHCLPCRNARM